MYSSYECIIVSKSTKELFQDIHNIDKSYKENISKYPNIRDFINKNRIESNNISLRGIRDSNGFIPLNTVFGRIYPSPLCNENLENRLENLYAIIRIGTRNYIYEPLYKTGNINRRSDILYEYVYSSLFEENKRRLDNIPSRLPEASILVLSKENRKRNVNVPEYLKLSENRFYDINEKYRSVERYINNAKKVLEKKEGSYGFYIPTVSIIKRLREIKNFNIIYASKPYTPVFPYCISQKISSNNIIITAYAPRAYYLSSLTLSKIIGITTALDLILPEYKIKEEEYQEIDISKSKFLEFYSQTKSEIIKDKIRENLSNLLEFSFRYGIFPYDIGFNQMAIDKDRNLYFIDFASGFIFSNQPSILINEIKKQLLESIDNNPYFLSCRKSEESFVECKGKNLLERKSIDQDILDIIKEEIEKIMKDYKKRKDIVDENSISDIKEYLRENIELYRGALKEIYKILEN